MTLQTLPQHLHGFSKSLNSTPLRHLGTRYSRDGSFLEEPGNTIVCHLVDGSMAVQAVIDARTRMQSLPESEKLAYTAESSLHMTLFQGIIEYRRKRPYWPADMALDTPIEAMTEHYLKQLEDFDAPGPFKVEVIGATPNGLTVQGLTDADRRIMKVWRDRLADIFGYRHPDHDSYRFHITFAYEMDRFRDEAMLEWHKGLLEILEDLQEAAPVIELEPPAFCSFVDMNHFEKLKVLA
ncbi:hypothetical protein SAMN04515647_2098 [Cohaesibacter sp. ES.047]|uniref:DUF1868 domain-containing protein n=1 Tax=Cohaesibacter sp. ES.047 TaxID=1798205 RepID=UPI000BB7170B|nr:DUF1868 domain-containing protein [Cohaesibacter sp. ES.047]SNY91854.1 hypothetical protein SAMN04515647_2098 [Cohaesibacter sp. ES.047]